jgi:hypothetical protein
VQVVSLSLLSTPNATEVNEVRFGYSRYRTSFNSADGNLDPSTIGLDTGTGITGLPEVDFGGIFDNLGATVFGIPRGRVSQTDQILDNFTWLRGRHTLKFGGQFWRANIASSNDNYRSRHHLHQPRSLLQPVHSVASPRRRSARQLVSGRRVL